MLCKFGHSTRSALDPDATAGAASTPIRPRCEFTRLGIRQVASPRFVQGRIAGSSFMHRLLKDPPLTIPLARFLRVTASPHAPTGEDAVLRLIAPCRAWLCIQQVASTGLAALIVHGRNDTLALTETNTRGSCPLSPIAEVAVPGGATFLAIYWLNARYCFDLCPLALRFPCVLEEVVAVIVCQSQLSRAHRGALATLSRAAWGRPVRPCTKDGVAVKAGLRG
mmetsp:Transcript_82370/g.172525  ORF Transcript_82370/g.172525 Transcript_82370/m.172525 type:complete len:223 (+) Transcript_82370:2232-2900(+)